LRRRIVALLALLSLFTGLALASPAQVGVEIHGPLDAFNMTHCFYRSMNITMTMGLENLLSPAPPPWCPSLAPVDGVLTCSCRLEPRGWWPNATWSMMLGPGEKWSSTVITAVPGGAGLGAHGVGYGCECGYTVWCRYTTTRTFCAGWYNGTCTETWTTTLTRTRTTTTTTKPTASSTVTVLPRTVNQSLLGLDLNVTSYKALGNGSVLVNISAKLYNLGMGLRIGNETPIPVEKGMLLLHNLTLYVDGVPAINLSGYGAPAREIPVNGTEPEPSAEGGVSLILTPPGRPSNEYTFNVTICYTEDKPEPVKTCVSQNITVPLPFGWRETLYIADDCRVINETWEVVPANETGIETVLVVDEVKPSITARDYCIVASAGACEPVRLDVYSGGVLVASRTGRGNATWCPAEPGTYTATAVDQFNNTVEKTFTITWSAGPPPAVKRALLGLAATIIAVMVGLYIILEGRWPLR